MKRCPACNATGSKSILVDNPKGGWIMKLVCNSCNHQDDVIKFYIHADDSIIIQ